MSATPAPKLFLGTVRGHTFQELISIMKSPCGTTAAEARARGCRFGINYILLASGPLL
jgi:hypothetical protein